MPEKKKPLHSPWNLGKIASWHDRWRLVVDPNLEAGGAPVNKLDRPRLEDCVSDWCITGPTSWS